MIRRVGLAYPGDIRLADMWSEIPSRLFRAFEGEEIDVESLRADPSLGRASDSRRARGRVT
jgi:hypothetical protein